MTILYVILIFFVAVNIRFRKNSVDDWLRKEDTTSINGVFILLVFLSHAMSYFPEELFSGWFNGWGRFLNGRIGQLMVVPFLFFSGYGVSQSIERKGADYVKQIPRKRMLAVLINFDVAVLCFAVLYLIINHSLSAERLLKSLICWDSMGNSNWYIFTILVCYACSYLSAMLSKRPAAICFMLLIVYSFVMPIWKPAYWYNTVLAFAIGMLMSENKKRIANLLEKQFYTVVAMTLLLFVTLYIIPFGNMRCIKMNVCGVFFATSIALLSYRFRIENKFLLWCGASLFPIYIYQRIPMIIFSNHSFNILTLSPVLFVVLSFIVTVGIATLYQRCMHPNKNNSRS